MSRKLQLFILCLCSLIAFAEQASREQKPNLKGEIPRASALHVKIEGGSIRLEGHTAIASRIRFDPFRRKP